MSNPKIYFIKANDGEILLMEEAFLACKSQQIETLLCNIAEFTNIHIKQFNPNLRNIVVTDKFAGDDFDKLKELGNIRLVGPLCVLACLNEGISIPNCKWPLLNIAMKGTVVCCSGISKENKAHIKELVKLMYGKVTGDYLANTTHLVTDSVITVKYCNAAENGKRIMTPLWVDAIWKESQSRIVGYDNEQFDKYKCPVFYNLRICGTGMSRPLSNSISALIVKHGGSFTNEMQISKTDVLICHGDNINTSSKYKAVINRRGAAANIRCLSTEWIHNSIKQGYALPEEKYAIFNRSSNRSTPYAKSMKDNGMDSEMFLISHIITDTDISTISCSTIDGTLQPDNTKQDIDKTIDLSVLKHASTFLDECNIYLTCITGDNLAFVQRALKYTGATRFDAYTDRVTHVVVGDVKNDANRQELQSLIERVRNQHVTHVVSIRWLVDSIKKQALLAEDAYSVSMEISPQGSQDIDGSPLSKKGLKLLRTDTSIHIQDSKVKGEDSMSTSTTFKAPDELQQYMETDNGTFARYMNDGNTEDLTGIATLKNSSDQSVCANIKPDEKENEAYESNFLKSRKRTIQSKTASRISTSSVDTLSEYKYEATRNDSTASETDEDQTLGSIFDKKTFQLLQFSGADTDDLTQLINHLGGCVVSRTSGVRPYRGVTDYAIVPLLSDREATSKVTADHVLNDIWLRECADKQRLVQQQYYHRCVTEAESKLLDGCVVSASAFKEWEQRYLFEVIVHMGGITQGDLSKKLLEKRGLLVTTHLLTNCTTNKKYVAAKRWGLPTVSSCWVEDSLRSGKRLPEVNFPVLGETTTEDITFATPHVVDRTSKKKIATATTIPLSSVTPCADRIKKPIIPESPQFQSPVLSQLSPQLSPVSRKYKDVMERIKWKVDQGLLYDSDCDSPSSTRLREQVELSRTPETPLSPFSAKLVGPNSTRSERKELRDFLNKIPNNTPPPAPTTRRLSTPMSELKRQFIAKCDEKYEKECQKLRKEALEREALARIDDDVFGNNSTDTDMKTNTNNPTTSKIACVPAHIIDEKMRNLSNVLGTPILNNKATKPTVVTPISGFSELPDSQTYSVGWDYDVELSAPKPNTEVRERVFLVTNFTPADKDALKIKIERLGAKVAPEQPKYTEVTHLLCIGLARNQKILCCMASGKWVLHSDYIDESLKAGKFLDEELFEFSNPKCKILVDDNDLEKARSAVYWRKTVEKTGKGAFHDMRAIIMGNNDTTYILNIIEAGGGTVVESRPPYENNDYATHCLVDTKTANVSDLVPLAKCGIYCVPHIYVLNFLINRNLEILQAVLSKLTSYYSK